MNIEKAFTDGHFQFFKGIISVVILFRTLLILSPFYTKFRIIVTIQWYIVINFKEKRVFNLKRSTEST